VLKTVFATAGMCGKGRYLDGPMDWMVKETPRIVSNHLIMNLHAKFAGSSGAALAELESALKSNRAVVVI